MLDLNELANGLPGITPTLGGALAEAAAVCLTSQGHRQGVHLRIVGYVNDTHSLVWPDVSEQTLRTWADSQEATEYGATAVAVLLIKLETGYLALEEGEEGYGV